MTGMNPNNKKLLSEIKQRLENNGCLEQPKTAREFYLQSELKKLLELLEKMFDKTLEV